MAREDSGVHFIVCGLPSELVVTAVLRRYPLARSSVAVASYVSAQHEGNPIRACVADLDRHAPASIVRAEASSTVDELARSIPVRRLTGSLLDVLAAPPSTTAISSTLREFRRNHDLFDLDTHALDGDHRGPQRWLIGERQPGPPAQHRAGPHRRRKPRPVPRILWDRPDWVARIHLLSEALLGPVRVARYPTTSPARCHDCTATAVTGSAIACAATCSAGTESAAAPDSPQGR
ncbi:hypothetical protein M8C13_32455 [Crossiella sp. SN42]|uniref:hypothetical protein n=1 Tax=Crossiella sp. SN42 TaxID=2944808 RepID=UPI00207CA70E|nr:hypothetical protein [Crossiella sp. SN42]MCO1580476.1 hypothetical protein [Crossiella sp. SN42]